MARHPIPLPSDGRGCPIGWVRVFLCAFCVLLRLSSINTWGTDHCKLGRREENWGTWPVRWGKPSVQWGKPQKNWGRPPVRWGRSWLQWGRGRSQGSDAKNMGTGGGPLGTDSDALRTLLRDWGSRPENRNADGRRPGWGKNFPGQGAFLLRDGFQ